MGSCLGVKVVFSAGGSVGGNAGCGLMFWGDMVVVMEPSGLGAASLPVWGSVMVGVPCVSNAPVWVS